VKAYSARWRKYQANGSGILFPARLALRGWLAAMEA